MDNTSETTGKIFPQQLKLRWSVLDDLRGVDAVGVLHVGKIANFVDGFKGLQAETG